MTGSAGADLWAVEILRLNPRTLVCLDTKIRNGKLVSQGHLFVSCISAMLSRVFITGSKKYGRSRESERRRNPRASERDRSARFNRHVSLVTRQSLVFQDKKPLLTLSLSHHKPIVLIHWDHFRAMKWETDLKKKKSSCVKYKLKYQTFLTIRQMKVLKFWA